MICVRRARLHRPGPDHRPADRRHRPVGRSAGRLPGRRRVVLRQRRQVRRRSMLLGLRPDGRSPPRRRAPSTASLIRFAQVHPGRRDPGAPTSRCRASASCCATHPGGFIAAVGHRRHHRPRSGRSRSSSSSSWSLTLAHGVRAALDAAGAGGCAPSARTRSRPAASASRVDRTVVLGYVASSLFVVPRRARADGPARHRRPGAGRRLHADQHHRGRARRHQPARRPGHVRRHAARRRCSSCRSSTRPSSSASTQTWQYFFQGVLILVAAVIYSQVRGTRAGVR